MRFKSSALRCVLVGTASYLVMAACTPAYAQERSHPLAITSQSLGGAINALSQQSGDVIIAPSELLEGKTAPRLEGSYTTEAALTRLLADTGLEAMQDPSGAFVVQQTEVQRTGPTGSVLDEIIVTGIRQALTSAQQIKRESDQIVDAVVADDIGKLPDLNVAEALQRVTGVQITRSQGEGDGIAIRGLTQIITNVDGRELFTANPDRSILYSDIPSELIAAVKVYKTPTSDQVEGGIGGSIDIRTRRPLEGAAGRQFALSAQAEYGDLADNAEPRLSLLLSDDFDTSFGEVGAQLSVAYQNRSYRFDQVRFNNLTRFTNFVDFDRDGTFPGDAGDAVLFSNGLPSTSYRTGTRERLGLVGTLQWRPTSALEFTAQAYYTDFSSTQDTFAFFASGPLSGNNALNISGVSLVPGTDFVSGATFTSGTAVAGASTPSFFNDRVSDTSQLSLEGVWNEGPWEVSGDVSYTDSFNETSFGQVGLALQRLDNLTVDLTGDLPTITTTTNLLDPSRYVINNVGDFIGRQDGDLLATRLDVTYEMDRGPIREISAGVRYADRAMSLQQLSVFSNISGRPLMGDFESFAEPVPFSDLFGGRNSGQIISQFYTSSISASRNRRDELRSLVGLTPLGSNPALDPTTLFELDEETTAAYLVGDFAFDVAGLPVSGNVGVRYAQTDLTSEGLRTATGGGRLPIVQNSSYDDTLPSLNLKADLTDTLIFRFSASKVITRPNFQQLSPSLNLDFTFARGSGGNPDLQPLRANQLDTTLEWYFSDLGYLYAAAFAKDVDGFVQTIVNVEDLSEFGISTSAIGGAPATSLFTITRPRNGEDGKIRGIEIGYQQRFTFLPGLLDGLGVYANYTYVDSESPSPVVGIDNVPLPNLSENSYNIVGFYEKGPFSARLAYNWRDEFVTGFNVDQNFVQSTSAQGFWDASLYYRYSNRISGVFQIVNLDRPARDRVLNANGALPGQIEMDDRRFLFGLNYRF